jgi:hypothetical protein
MIAALTALRSSLPAVVNPNRPILVTSPLNSRPLSRLAIGNVQLLCTAGAKNSDRLQLIAICCKTAPFIFIHLQPLFSHFYARLSLFSSTSSLFFAKQGGRGSMTNFFQLKMKAPKEREPRTAWGEAIRGLGVTARTGP